MQEGGNLGIPVLAGVASPGAQETQADFATGVKVGVETTLGFSGGGEVDFGRARGVVLIEEDVELEGSVGIGSVLGPHDHGLHDVDSLLVASDKDTVGVLAGETGGEVGYLLGESDHLLLSLGLLLGDHAVIVVLIDSVLADHVDVVEPEVLEQLVVLLLERQLEDVVELVFALELPLALLLAEHLLVDMVVSEDDLLGQIGVVFSFGVLLLFLNTRAVQTLFVDLGQVLQFSH